MATEEGKHPALVEARRRCTPPNHHRHFTRVCNFADASWLAWLEQGKKQGGRRGRSLPALEELLKRALHLHLLGPPSPLYFGTLEFRASSTSPLTPHLFFFVFQHPTLPPSLLHLLSLSLSLPSLSLSLSCPSKNSGLPERKLERGCFSLSLAPALMSRGSLVCLGGKSERERERRINAWY